MQQKLRHFVALAVCAAIANPMLIAERAREPAAEPATPNLNSPARATTALTPDQRIVHLLSRFTFGPTPAEIANARRLGVDRWFDEQLHPERIADSQLEARLADFPALRLPVAQLMERFPSGAAIRQTADGRRAIPNDPELAAIYTRHIHLYEEKQEKKAEAKASPPAAEMASNNKKTAGSGAAQMDTTEAMTSGAANPVRTRSANADPAGKAVLAVLALSPADRVDRILAMQPAEYEPFQAGLNAAQKTRLVEGMTPAQRELLLDFDHPTRAVIQELQAQRLLRDIYSSRQLQEVMTSFWLNHFNVYLHKNDEEPYYLVSYERDVIRPRALGNFEDLLIATAESPAMLLYLDNSASTGPDSKAVEKQKQRAALGKPTKNSAPGLNENYARELMELHTLGVNGGYTQKDITEVAKVFTGWTVDKPGQGGGFKFDESRHEPGKKLVLGHKIKENGQKEGLQLLHMLANSSATAHFISQELAVAFVSDTPPPALVNRMAKSFLASHGDIPTVLRTMLHSAEFWSPATYQAKVKTPLEYVVSAARASSAEISNTQPLVNALNQMGMPLYACVPPTGYPSKAEEWVSTGALVTRMNFALSLATNHNGGVKTDWTPPDLPDITSDLSEQALEARLIPAGVSAQTRTAVLNQAATQTQASMPARQLSAVANPPNAAQTSARNAQLAGLLLGSPEFQRR